MDEKSPAKYVIFSHQGSTLIIRPQLGQSMKLYMETSLLDNRWNQSVGLYMYMEPVKKMVYETR